MFSRKKQGVQNRNGGKWQEEVEKAGKSLAKQKAWNGDFGKHYIALASCKASAISVMSAASQ